MRVLLASVALTLVLVGCADGENRPQLEPRRANVTPTTEVSSDAVAPAGASRAGDASAAGPTAAGEDAPRADDLDTRAALAVPASAPAPDGINLRDPLERARVAGVLEAADGLGSRASIRVSDRPLVGAERFVLGTWAAVVPQRHAVLDVSAAAVRAAVAGELRDWADLGGRPGPVVVMVAVGDQDSLPRALAIPRLGDAVQLLSRATLVEAVRATPGALAIVPVGWLEPGLLPLVVDGWDPLRDPA